MFVPSLISQRTQQRDSAVEREGCKDARRGDLNSIAFVWLSITNNMPDFVDFRICHHASLPLRCHCPRACSLAWYVLAMARHRSFGAFLGMASSSRFHETTDRFTSLPMTLPSDPPHCFPSASVPLFAIVLRSPAVINLGYTSDALPAAALVVVEPSVVPRLCCPLLFCLSRFEP